MAAELLIFDGDCGFCTSTANWARRRLPRRVAVRPWQRIPDLASYRLSTRDVSAAAYWIDAKGRTHRAHFAVAEAFRTIGGIWWLVGTLMRVPPFSWIAEVAYDVVARNRHRLPGGTPACQLPDPPKTVTR